MTGKAAIGRAFLAVAFAAALVCLAAEAAHAAEQADNSLDKILKLYRDNAKAWQEALADLALGLFWLLAAIELAWSGVWLAVRGAELGEWLSEFLVQILFIGFFLALLTNSAVWAEAIVQSFRLAADRAAAASHVQGGLTPSDVFDTGLAIAAKVMEQTTFWRPADSAGLMIAALIVVICFALIAAFIVIALVESYVVISAGVLLMGFGGSRWTKDFAVAGIVYAVSVGAKLLVLQLLVALGQQLFQEWSGNFAGNNADVFVVVGSAIVMVALTKSVPDIIQGLINGASPASGRAMTAAVGGAAAAGVAAVAAAAGQAGAAMAAGRLASEQLADQEPERRARTKLGRAAGYARRATLNLAGAALETAGRRLGGRAMAGTRFGGQMAENLELKAERRREERRARQERAPVGVIRGGERRDA